MKPNRSTSFLSQEEFDRIKGQYAKFNEPWETTEVEELGRSINAVVSRLVRLRIHLFN